MTDQLKMFDQMTCEDSRNVTSLQASADGLALCDSLAGQMIEPSGPAVALVSRSRSRASKKASKIQDTSGLNGSVLSPSENLQYVLENKLRELLTGSVSCEVIWKKWVTPWGQSLSKPRARTRIISEIDIGLWPTVTTPSGGQTIPEGTSISGKTPDGRKLQVTLQNVVKQVAISLWPTMTSNAPAKGYNEAGNSAGQVAIRKIILALWPTATASDHKSRSASQATLDRNARPLREVIFALWSTIRASDGAKGGPNMSFGAGGSPLPSQVSTEANTSNAPMENGGGSLHPEFAGWEMGYQPEWLSCAPLVTRSIRGAQRSSSKRMSKQPADTDEGKQ